MRAVEGALATLLSRRKAAGRVTWIGLRPSRGAVMVELERAELLTDRGLSGDVASLRAGGKRQLSILQAEHLPVIAQLVQRAAVEPALLRRNLVVAGINILALRHRSFRVGGVLLRGTGACEPCSKMERALGEGGYNAMRGHGGILAQVVLGGPVQLGDVVDFADTVE